MQTVTTIGLDIAKSVFQVHGVDAAGQVLIRRQLKRRSGIIHMLDPVDVAMSARSKSHYMYIRVFILLLVTPVKSFYNFRIVVD